MRHFILFFSTALVWVPGVLHAPQAQAAACCGGAGILPALMTGDQKGEVGLGVAQADAQAQSGPQGRISSRAEGSIDRTSRLTFTASHLLTDSWQLGTQLTWVSRELRPIAGVDANQLQDLGDFSLTLGNEFLPELTYSRWKPRGFAFFSFSHPLGPSIHELDPLNSGEFRTVGTTDGTAVLSAGWIFTKILGSWDVLHALEGSHSLSRTFSGTLTLGTQNRWNTQFGAGWTYRGSILQGSEVRLGGRISATGKSRRQTEELGTEFTSVTEPTRLFTPSFDLTWMPNSESRLGLAYSNPAWLASFSRGVTLERSVSLNFAKTWER
jgi:hypothetical protein